MANNPYKNKIVYNGTTLIDLTDDDVTAADVAQGKKFHLPSGQPAVGTATGGSITVVDTQDSHGGIIRTITAETIQTQTKSATPTESQQTINPDEGYLLSSVTVGAVSSTYVGSGISRKSSSDLTVSGATVTAPAGYYSSNASKSVASGSVTAPSSISGTSATVSTGTNTLTLSKTVSVTPNVTTAGYISSGTAGNASVSLTASVTTKAAATINTSSSDQTIASGTYLTGAQTIRAVTVSGLSASNIAAGVTVQVGDTASAGRIANVTGTLAFVTYYTGSTDPSPSLGSDGDIYLKVAN